MVEERDGEAIKKQPSGMPGWADGLEELDRREQQLGAAVDVGFREPVEEAALR
jgi:hypothetical protein